MTDEAKCCAATPAATLEQHITDVNVAKNEAEWWAYREITRLREENARLREVLKPFLTKHPAGVNADDYDWLLVKPDDIRRAQAAIREGGKE